MADKVKVSQYDGTHVKVGNRLERFDKGAAIPEYADPEHVKLLEERGMVADGEPFGGLTATPGPVAFNVEEDASKSKSSGKSS